MSLVYTYKKLVERDSRFVSRGWQIMIICLLMGCALCNLVAGFKIHFIDMNFQKHCFINSKLAFKVKPAEIIVRERDESSDESTESEMDDDLELDIDYSYIVSLTEIDKYASVWGNPNGCKAATVAPLIFSFCAVVWIIIYLTCGRAGSPKSLTRGKPWKIVVPSLTFFILASNANLVLLIVVKSTLDGVCTQLNNHLSAVYHCGELLDEFSLVDRKDPHYSKNCYSVIVQMLIMAYLFWIISAFTTVIRMVLRYRFSKGPCCDFESSSIPDSFHNVRKL